MDELIKAGMAGFEAEDLAPKVTKRTSEEVRTFVRLEEADKPPEKKPKLDSKLDEKVEEVADGPEKGGRCERWTPRREAAPEQKERTTQGRRGFA